MTRVTCFQEVSRSIYKHGHAPPQHARYWLGVDGHGLSMAGEPKLTTITRSQKGQRHGWAPPERSRASAGHRQTSPPAWLRSRNSRQYVFTRYMNGHCPSMPEHRPSIDRHSPNIAEEPKLMTVTRDLGGQKHGCTAPAGSGTSLASTDTATAWLRSRN